jgi:aspartate ammonia-lyase
MEIPLMKYPLPTLAAASLALAFAALSPLASAETAGAMRTEKDLLGEKQIPVDALYGVQTARALENFRISGRELADYPELVDAFVLTKIAAARANAAVGALDREVAEAIVKGGEAIIAGKYRDQFRVDPYQGGAGTSTNMNVNEVLANAALLETGRVIGEYQVVSPLDHVNLSQSTNDSYPTALKVAIASNNDALVAELEQLVAAFRAKGDEFLHVLKMGRTEMQDAVPMTLGQEFHAFAAALESEIPLIRAYEQPLFSINMGGTAIGTGLNAPEGYAEATADFLAKLTGKPYAPAGDLIASTWDQQAFLSASAATRSLAVKLSKVASDLILLSSGPRAGFGDINLPPQQPGSSIMPGKVNPVIPELTNLVSFRVIGNDLTVALAARNGQLQLNAYEPLEALAILESQRILNRAMRTLRERCVDGITANEDTLAGYIERTVGIVTALNPVLGYAKATELARRAYESDRGIIELLRTEKILTEQQIEELLDPEKLTGLKADRYSPGKQP